MKKEEIINNFVVGQRVKVKLIDHFYFNILIKTFSETGIQGIDKYGQFVIISYSDIITIHSVVGCAK